MSPGPLLADGAGSSVTVKPPVPYFGAKVSIAERIVQVMPPHRHYVEPYAGSLSVLLAKPRADFETVNDLDGDLVTFWRVLRDRPDDLARVCMLTPHSRAEHAASYDLADVAELERARRVWVRLTQGRQGMMRRTGWKWYRDAGRRVASGPATIRSLALRMLDAADRIAGVSLECRPALDIIASTSSTSSVLLYVDPPYVRATRSCGRNYRHEMSDDDHRELVAALRDCCGPVILSGYPSALYDGLLPDWHTLDIPAWSQGRPDGQAQRRVERLWLNYEPDGRLW